MTFTVTYRDKTGARREEALEAISREAAFAAMKTRGIVPTAVRAGLTKPRNTRNTRNTAVPYIIAVAFVLLLAGGAWWWLGRDGARPSLPDEVSSKPKAMPKEVVPAAPIPATHKSIDKEQLGLSTDQAEWKRRGFKKNPWGTPIPKDLEYKPHWLYTPEDYARIDPGYAERHESFKRRQAANPWKTTADSQLSVLLFSKPGMPNLLVPFDRHFDKHFLKSLETPIIINTEKDSPELQEQKRQMIEVKAYLKEQLDAGKDIAAILNEERDKQVKLRGLRENLEKALREMEKSAKSVEEVEDYIAGANKMLEEQGGAGAGKVGLPLVLTRMRLEKESASGGQNTSKEEGVSK